MYTWHALLLYGTRTSINHIHIYVCGIWIYTCMLQENDGIARIYQNVVGTRKVTIAKKLIFDLNFFWVKKWNLCSLVYVLNKFESLTVVVKK